MKTITAITAARNSTQRAVVKVNGKPVVTLSLNQIGELGLVVDQSWDEAIAAKVHAAADYDRAYRAAATRLNRCQLSTYQLSQKLSQLGHSTLVLNRVIARLTDLGFLNDHALGQAIIQSIMSRKPAGPRFLRAKLRQRGLPDDLVDRLIQENKVDAQTAVDQATALVHQRLKTMPAKLNPAVRRRRLWGLLARRGFDPDTIEQALSQLPHSTDSDGDEHIA